MREVVKINPTDFATISICAIRYCHGRQSYMPSLVLGIVKNYIDIINDKDLQVMINDCEYQERCNLYGSETIDKPDWLRWKEFLLEERKRREGDAE